MNDLLSAADPHRWLDLACVFLLAWIIFARLYRSRAHVALLGLTVLGGLYLASRTLNLELTSWFLRGLLTVSAVLVVIAYQDELRRTIERVGTLGFFRRPRGSREATETMVEALRKMANERVGALVVLTGAEPIDRYVNGQVEVEAKLSVPLLLSLFDPHSPGHDGALIWDGSDRIQAFAGHLPLSVDTEQLVERGTRHAAALGLSERSDATCFVVSEERGTISVAHDGQLTLIPGEALAARIGAHLEGRRIVHTPVRTRLFRGLAQAGAAALLTAGAWFALLHGSVRDTAQLRASVAVENLPEGWSLESVEPADMDVTVSAPRRQLLLLQDSEVSVVLDASAVARGRRHFRVRPEDVAVPDGVDAIEVSEPRVSIQASVGPTASSD